MTHNYESCEICLAQSRFVTHFITLPCILLLSSCFGFTCTPLTLLQLRYILWCFIDCFRIVFGDLTCAFLSGVKDFMHLLCTIIGHDIFNILIIPSQFHAHCLGLLGRISGSNMFALMFLTQFSLYFFHTYGRTLLYKYACYRPPVLE